MPNCDVCGSWRKRLFEAPNGQQLCRFCDPTPPPRPTAEARRSTLDRLGIKRPAPMRSAEVDALRRQLAIHEAAHAVACFRCGVTIHCVRVGGRRGSVERDATDELGDAIIALAPAVIGLQPSYGDRLKVDPLIAKEALWRAEGLFDNGGRAMVDEVAQALLEQGGHLRGAEVALICEGVERFTGDKTWR